MANAVFQFIIRATNQAQATLQQNQAALQQTQASRDLADATNGRDSRLVKQGWLTLQQGDNDRLTLAAQQAAVNVAQSNIVWQSPQLAGSGADLSVADLDHDGVLEVIALTDSNLYVFGRASNSVQFSQRASVALPNSTKLLVADTDNDGESEIFVVANTGYYGLTSELRTFDRALQPLRMVALTVRATNLILEPSAFARKNLLISTCDNNYSYYTPAPSEIWAIDAVSGAGIWRSPAFPGVLSRESLHTVDVDLDGQYELSFGTAIGAFISR